MQNKIFLEICLTKLKKKVKNPQKCVGILHLIKGLDRYTRLASSTEKWPTKIMRALSLTEANIID